MRRIRLGAGYYDTATNLMFAIGAILGIVGAIRVFDVDQWGAAYGAGGGDVVRGLHIPCGGGDGDQIILRLVMGCHGGESLSY